MTEGPQMDAEELRAEAQREIKQFLLRQHDLPYVPEVEVGPLKYDPGPFPETTSKFTGELFVAAPRLAAKRDDLLAAMERIDQGIKQEQILEGRVRSNTSGVQAQTVASPFYEEGGKTPPSHVLNGWISALWGLWDVHVGLDDDGAGDAFNAGSECLLRHLDAYDIGWWTRYSLYPHPIEDLAKPIYNAFHTNQVDVLHRLTGMAEFGDAARRWREYDTLANRARAVAQKAVFTATRVARERSRRER
jgi:hypothetical protein